MSLTRSYIDLYMLTNDDCQFIDDILYSLDLYDFESIVFSKSHKQFMKFSCIDFRTLARCNLLNLLFLQANSNVLEYIINHGIHIEAADSYGRRAIHYAAMYCDLNIIKLFFKKKINLRCPDITGHQPIHYAHYFLRFPTVKFLNNLFSKRNLNKIKLNKIK